MYDRLGSVRLVMDEAGEVVNQFSYDPYGNPIREAFKSGTIYNSYHRFAGYKWDAAVGMYDCNARWYDPVMMRFTGRDPVRGDFNEPLSLHRYLYCVNEPVNIIDPTGLEGNLSELNFTQGVQNGMRAYGAADQAHQVYGYVEMFTSGLSLGNIMLTVAIDVGMDYAGGKVFQALADVRGGVMSWIRAKGLYGEVASGIAKNSKHIDSITGSAHYRIPDELTKTSLTEVKNVKNLNYTKQIEDFILYANKKNLTFTIRLNSGCKKIAKRIKELEKVGGIIIDYYD